MSEAFVNGIAEGWMNWIKGGLVDGSVALGLAGACWFALRRRLSHRLGAALFALVLLKCALPLPVVLQVLPPSALESPSPAARPSASASGAAGSSISAAVAGVSEAAHRKAQVPVAKPWSVNAWLLLMWLAGVVLGFLRLMWLALRTRSLVAAARIVPASEIEPLVAVLPPGDPLWKTLQVRISCRLRSPAVTGLWSPVLLLPEGLQDRLSPAQQCWAVAHELAHVRARDVAWQWLESLVQTLLFFHPAVWLAARHSASLRERACDEEAVRVSGTSRQTSAEGFLSLIEWSRQPVPLMGLSLGSAGREARSRIRALARGPLRQPARHWQVLMVVVCGAVMLPGLRPRQVQAQAVLPVETARIAELEKKVADLEAKLQAKSRLEQLRENATRRAHARANADGGRFSAAQLSEIESLYQTARKTESVGALAQGFQPLFDRFPAANRTGCAVLLLARMKLGAERDVLLRKAVRDHSDAYFLDATSVGAVARLMLVQDSIAAGRVAEAERWRHEIRASFAEELDFGAVPVIDLINTSPVRR